MPKSRLREIRPVRPLPPQLRLGGDALLSVTKKLCYPLRSAF